MKIDPNFWHGRRVFLTGHTGFKGGWLALWLQSMGAHVTGFALPPGKRPCLFEVAEIDQGIEHVVGDVRDAAHLAQAVHAAQPEIVIHLASRHANANPLADYAVNVMGTVNLLDAIRQTPGVRAVVVVTGDQCYAYRKGPWAYRENEALDGSKGCVELATATFRSACGLPVASARAGDVIGGGDWGLERLVPDMVRAIERKQPVLIRNPSAIHPWQHVLEPLSGYLVLAQHLFRYGAVVAEAFNFGPFDSDARPVKWVAERMCRAWGEGASWQLDGQPQEGSYMMLDCSKARAVLDWQPRWQLDEAIRRTAEWHKAAHARQDMRALTLAQINAYQMGSPLAQG